MLCKTPSLLSHKNVMPQSADEFLRKGWHYSSTLQSVWQRLTNTSWNSLVGEVSWASDSRLQSWNCYILASWQWICATTPGRTFAAYCQFVALLECWWRLNVTAFNSYHVKVVLPQQYCYITGYDTHSTVLVQKWIVRQMLTHVTLQHSSTQTLRCNTALHSHNHKSSITC